MSGNFVFYYDLLSLHEIPYEFGFKNDIGSLRSFIKKSLTRKRFSLTDICSNNHLLIKSIEVLPTTIINSPNNMRNIKFMSCLCMPISTMDCVKNGNIISNIHPTNNPIAIIARYFYIVEYIQSQPPMNCFFFNLFPIFRKDLVGSNNKHVPILEFWPSKLQYWQILFQDTRFSLCLDLLYRISPACIYTWQQNDFGSNAKCKEMKFFQCI